MPTVQVREQQSSPVVEAVEAAYVERFGVTPEQPGGWYHRNDWQRISFVLGLLQRGGDVLDVGVGAGQFLNSLAMSGEFRSVTGSDPTTFNKYIELVPGIDRQSHSVAALPFDDDSFDVVTCMEVLEHVGDDDFEAGLAELRRVCRGQLIMSVPFREPEPLSASHFRRFEPDDIRAAFPDGSYLLLDRPRMPWIIIEEWPNLSAAPAPGLRLAAVEAEVQQLRRQVSELSGSVARTAPRPTLSKRGIRWARRKVGAVLRRGKRLLRSLST